MNAHLNRRTLLLTALAVIIVISAFWRGSYLLGMGVGGLYVVVCGGLIYLTQQTLRQQPVAKWKLAVIAAIALPVGFIMAFPATLNPDMQDFIDRHSDNRASLRELNVILSSDEAFSDVTISTQQTKILNVTLHGSVATLSDLERLQTKVEGSELKKHCLIHWEIAVTTTVQ